MKKSIFTLTILTLFAALFMHACAPAPETAPTPASLASAYLVTDYADAASLWNQLAFGTLQLEGTPNAVTPGQAKELLPLWQAVLSLMGSDTVAEAELTALQDQIAQVMAVEQIQAIAAMQITNADLSAFYAEYGIVLPTPIPGVTKVSGSGSSVSQADREATKTAAQALGTPVGTGGGGTTGQASKTLLYEKVIVLLTEISTR
ncbi:MAG: hypothetical protein FD146_2338 [Anaerolineaceae bacterium]|nr:MAG: hypothetical protein FD146_2338 [Anaerolineaceae bacterium]